MTHAYSPKTLGDRWGCSAETIRQMCNRGDLTSFRPGPKLIRIPAHEVERFECQNTASSSTEANIASPTLDPMDGYEGRLARMTGGRQNLSLASSGGLSPSPRRDG